MKRLLLICVLLTSLQLFAQQTKITGTITDAATSQPVSGASITVKDKLTGTTTDAKGNFTLSIGKIKLPFTIVISSVNYEEKQVQVNAASETITISLSQKAALLNEVVTAASRVPENILASPVSIEKMNLKAIQENPSLTFYDGLQTLKGMEVVTSSLTYKQVNTRGFNSTGNSRFLQLIDGVDNQNPGLNFAVGNQFGASDLDMESVGVIPGAASALYCPVAFNGVLMMHTKDPFQYLGLTVQAKTGVNYIGEAAGIVRLCYPLCKSHRQSFCF